MIKITGEERTVGSKEEVQFSLSATFPSMQGYNFFLIHKQINGTVWKPVYKSEIQQATKNKGFCWNTVAFLSSDLASDVFDEDTEREIRFDFFTSQKSGRHTHQG